MTGWGRHLDELAAATAGLLGADMVRTTPLIDARGALASRDAVVAQLRELVGALSGVPRVAAARPLTVFDVTERPGQALHRALSGLPRSTDFGATENDFYVTKHLPPYEQLWRDAARACVGLEGFVDGLATLGEDHAWGVLRDLTDLAAALPALDHGLAEAVLPWLKDGEEDLGVPYAMLTHPGHDAVRVCTSEIRARVPADPPSRAGSFALPTVRGAGELDKAMDNYVRTVLDRGSALSIGDLRAVSRLLQYGALDAATVLQRSARVVPGAESAAHGLRVVAELSAGLRAAPAKTLGPERLAVLRDGGELQQRVRALAVQERQLPAAACDTDVRRLAAPALEFAKHVENLTRALEIGVREALAAGLMLVPSRADRSNRTELRWVTARMQHKPAEDDPLTVLASAEALGKAGQSVGLGVRVAQAEIGRHQRADVDRTSTAAATARAHAGTARAQLRTALSAQLADRPAPLASQLPAHPRLAPQGPVSGRSR